MRFENTTGQGNVKAFRIEITETPHSHAGKAHAKLVCELEGGRETTRDGKSFPTLAEAQAKGDEWAAMCIKSGLVRA